MYAGSPRVPQLSMPSRPTGSTLETEMLYDRHINPDHPGPFHSLYPRSPYILRTALCMHTAYTGVEEFLPVTLLRRGGVGSSSHLFPLHFSVSRSLRDLTFSWHDHDEQPACYHHTRISKLHARPVASSVRTARLGCHVIDNVVPHMHAACGRQSEPWRGSRHQKPGCPVRFRARLESLGSSGPSVTLQRPGALCATTQVSVVCFCSSPAARLARLARPARPHQVRRRSGHAPLASCSPPSVGD